MSEFFAATGPMKMMLQFDGVRRVCLCFFTLLWAHGATAGSLAPDDALDLQEYSGKVVVVHFWASWSMPCRRSFPWLAAMQEKYADQGLVVIGVNEDNDASAAHTFLEEFPVNFPNVRDADGELFETWDIVAMPSSYVVDRAGQIVARYLGFKSVQISEYEATLRETLTRR